MAGAPSIPLLWTYSLARLVFQAGMFLLCRLVITYSWTCSFSREQLIVSEERIGRMVTAEAFRTKMPSKLAFRTVEPETLTLVRPGVAGKPTSREMIQTRVFFMECSSIYRGQRNTDSGIHNQARARAMRSFILE